MTFWQRFRYYLIGVTLGMVISFFFFRGRGCAWLPENRVKNELLASVILYTDQMDCQLDCNNLTEADIYELFNSGDVKFDESTPNENPKIYVLEGKSENGETFKVAFAKKDTIVTLTKIIDGVDASACKCGTRSDQLKELKLPASTAKKMIGDRPLELNDLAECQKECYGLNQEQINELIREGEFMEEASNRRKRPYPELFFANDGFEVVVELTQETARIINLVKLSNPDCGCY